MTTTDADRARATKVLREVDLGTHGPWEGYAERTVIAMLAFATPPMVAESGEAIPQAGGCAYEGATDRSKLRAAIKQTEYKYFGDYEMSDGQRDAVDTLVEFAEQALSSQATDGKDAAAEPSKAVPTWMKRAIQFIDRCDSDVSDYDDMHADAEHLLTDGYALFGLEPEAACIATLERQDLATPAALTSVDLITDLRQAIGELHNLHFNVAGPRTYAAIETLEKVAAALRALPASQGAREGKLVERLTWEATSLRDAEKSTLKVKMLTMSHDSAKELARLLEDASTALTPSPVVGEGKP